MKNANDVNRNLKSKEKTFSKFEYHYYKIQVH